MTYQDLLCLYLLEYKCLDLFFFFFVSKVENVKVINKCQTIPEELEVTNQDHQICVNCNRTNCKITDNAEKDASALSHTKSIRSYLF